MELWIRSQDRKRLLKMNDIIFYERNGHYYIAKCYEDNLASYKSKERALEVLDEIEAILIYEKLERITGDAIIQVNNNVAIYEMPKE